MPKTKLRRFFIFGQNQNGRRSYLRREKTGFCFSPRRHSGFLFALFNFYDMKKIILTTFIFFLSSSLIFAQVGLEYKLGFKDGEKFAKKDYSGDWSLIGFGSGLLLPVVGVLITAGISQTGNNRPSTNESILTDSSVSYKNGFYEGYSKGIKKQKLTDCISGGIVATGIVVGVYFLIKMNRD